MPVENADEVGCIPHPNTVTSRLPPPDLPHRTKSQDPPLKFRPCAPANKAMLQRWASPCNLLRLCSGDYSMYYESDQGRKPLPFAIAEKIDNAVSATMVAPAQPTAAAAAGAAAHALAGAHGQKKKYEGGEHPQIDVYLCTLRAPLQLRCAATHAHRLVSFSFPLILRVQEQAAGRTTSYRTSFSSTTASVRARGTAFHSAVLGWRAALRSIRASSPRATLRTGFRKHRVLFTLLILCTRWGRDG
jgi:hypothetical protein